MVNMTFFTGCIEEVHFDRGKVRLVVDGKAALYPQKKNFFGSVGDRISLAGRVDSNGVFQATAYKNGSKQTQGVKSFVIFLIVGVFSTFLLLSLLDQDALSDLWMTILVISGPGYLIVSLAGLLIQKSNIKKCSEELERLSLVLNSREK
mgnify:CR=1 FL=1